MIPTRTCTRSVLVSMRQFRVLSGPDSHTDDQDQRRQRIWKIIPFRKDELWQSLIRA
jgi:hypothetical protein